MAKRKKKAAARPKKKAAPQKETDPMRAAVAALHKKHGKASAIVPGQGRGAARSLVRHAIPTGIEVLDLWILAIGGLPAGRLIEVYGEEGGCKTSLVLAFLAACQQSGGIAALCETEHSFSEERATTFDVDLDRLVIMEPGNMEEALSQQKTFLGALPDGGQPSLIVWDSIAATPLKSELEGEIGDAAVGKRARLLSDACRQLPSLADRKNVCLVWVNQIREKIGVFFGDKTTTPGGRAVKFHASVRLQILGGRAEKDKHGDHIAKIPTIMAPKNRFAPPWRKAKVKLSFAEGWDNVWSTVSWAKDRGLVPEGARYVPKNHAKALRELRKLATTVINTEDLASAVEDSMTEDKS